MWRFKNAIVQILPRGFDVGPGQGEELAVKWDGKTIVLKPLKKVNFE